MLSYTKKPKKKITKLTRASRVFILFPPLMNTRRDVSGDSNKIKADGPARAQRRGGASCFCNFFGDTGVLLLQGFVGLLGHAQLNLRLLLRVDPRPDYFPPIAYLNRVSG